jgi:hypothetical protein
MLSPHLYHACRKGRRISGTDGRLPYLRSPMRKTFPSSALAPLTVAL